MHLIVKQFCCGIEETLSNGAYVQKHLPRTESSIVEVWEIATLNSDRKSASLVLCGHRG